MFPNLVAKSQRRYTLFIINLFINRTNRSTDSSLHTGLHRVVVLNIQNKGTSESFRDRDSPIFPIFPTF